MTIHRILDQISQALKLNTYWEDLRVTVNSVKVSGTRPPEWTDYKGGQVLAFEDQAVEGNEEIVYFTVQLPHAWKYGSDLHAHVHWVPEDNTAGNVRWKLTASWANIGGVFPTETEYTVDAAAPAVADTHSLAELGELDGTGKTLSSMIVCSLSRNSSHANDTLTGKDAYLLEIDFHYEIDSFGSDNEYTG